MPGSNFPFFTFDVGSEHIVKVFSDDFSTPGPEGLYTIRYAADFVDKMLLDECQNTSVPVLSYQVNIVNNCPFAQISIDPNSSIFIDLSIGHTAVHKILLDPETKIVWSQDSDITTDSPNCGALIQELYPLTLDTNIFEFVESVSPIKSTLKIKPLSLDLAGVYDFTLKVY